jgi:hypothetical protein
MFDQRLGDLSWGAAGHFGKLHGDWRGKVTVVSLFGAFDGNGVGSRRVKDGQVAGGLGGLERGVDLLDQERQDECSIHSFDHTVKTFEYAAILPNLFRVMAVVDDELVLFKITTRFYHERQTIASLNGMMEARAPLTALTLIGWAESAVCEARTRLGHAALLRPLSVPCSTIRLCIFLLGRAATYGGPWLTSSDWFSSVRRTRVHLAWKLGCTPILGLFDATDKLC